MAGIRKLTRAAIDRAKPGPAIRRLSDGDALYLAIMPTGAKLWRFDYRLGDTRKTISYGAWPQVGIEEARTLHAAARERWRAGQDPVEARRAMRMFTNVEPTVADVVASWLKKRKGGWAASHYARTKGRVDTYILPRIGRRKIGAVTTRDLVSTCEAVKAKDTSHRVAQILSAMFRYAKKAGEIDDNPATDLRGALPALTHEHFPAPTDPDRVGEILLLLDGYRGGIAVRSLIRLQPLLFTRPSELRLAKWSEIDLDAGRFVIPAVRMKRTLQAKLRGDSHIVPLPSQAVAILRDLHRATGPSGFVFESARGRDRPISDMAAGAALSALDISRDEVSMHGWRATKCLGRLRYCSLPFWPSWRSMRPTETTVAPSRNARPGAWRTSKRSGRTRHCGPTRTPGERPRTLRRNAVVAR